MSESPAPLAKDKATDEATASGEHEAPLQNAPSHDAAPEAPPPEPAPRVDGLRERGTRALSVVAETTARTIQRATEDLAQARQQETEAWQDTEERADLPELADGSDPLLHLLRRADREADFHRSLAVRSLRPGAGRLLAVAAGGVALVGGTILAIAAGVRAFFGADIGDAPGHEALALAIILGVAACVGVLLERDQRRRAEASLARAALAERRLERLSAILALRDRDAARFADMVGRIEREPTR